MISIKYQLRSARPTAVQIFFQILLICLVAALAIFRVGSNMEILIYLYWLFDAILACAFLVTLQRYISLRTPLEIETSDQLIIKYENGKIDQIPYRKIFRCAAMGTKQPAFLKAIFQFFLGPSTQLIIEVKPARILPMYDRELAEKICDDIGSKAPPGQPDLAPHPLP